MSRLTLPNWLWSPLSGLAVTVGVLITLTGLLASVAPEQLLNAALLYLLVTVAAAAVWGYRIGLFAAVLADVLLNFFFVPPVGTFTVHQPENVLALAVFLAVAVVGASMLALLQRQVAIARSREAEANILLDLNHAVAQATTPEAALAQLCAVACRALRADACAVLREDGGAWHVAASTDGDTQLPGRDEASLAEAALRGQALVARGGSPRTRLRSRRPANAGGPRLTYIPFSSQSLERGVLRVTGTIAPPPLVDPARLLAAIAEEASIALHRSRLSAEAQRAAALERADEFKSVLLSSVSHDLRSPLTAIKAAVGSLRSSSVSWSTEDIDDFLATIESQTDVLTATVADLLQMSRLEGGAVDIAVGPIQAGPLLHDVAATTRLATQGRTVEIEADDAFWLSGDYGLLLQALVNLVENAARYSTPGGRIHLGATRGIGARIHLTVRDDGPGIPPEDLPHVFEKFYRGVQTKRTAGTGLGLAIVQAMVELNGGTVSVRPDTGGTEFTLSLPAAERAG